MGAYNGLPSASCHPMLSWQVLSVMTSHHLHSSLFIVPEKHADGAGIGESAELNPSNKLVQSFTEGMPYGQVCVGEGAAGDLFDGWPPKPTEVPMVVVNTFPK